MSRNSYYYNIKDTIKKYPDCWCYIIVGGRNTGKTYSTLKATIDDNFKFIFVKRTDIDVDTLCSEGSANKKRLIELEYDLSPFADLNDDLGLNVRARKIVKGLGGFWDFDEENEPIDTKPRGYIFSLNKVGKYKGFGGLRECKWLIFDEFIAQPWERVSREEGNQLMELYKTVSRDRQHRGQPALKLICLANANDISNPIFNTLEITDDVSNMIFEGIHQYETRGICIELVEDNPDFYEKEKETEIYKAMHDTVWGRMAFDNEFSRNDFTPIKKHFNLKNATPVFSVKFQKEIFYTWKTPDGIYLTCFSKHDKNFYNLDIEGDRRRLYYRQLLNIKDAVMAGRAFFKTYRMYDLYFHFKEFYNI